MSSSVLSVPRSSAAEAQGEVAVVSESENFSSPEMNQSGTDPWKQERKAQGTHLVRPL